MNTGKTEGVDALALFNAYRDYVKHEDGLLNQRHNWNLVIQGFLLSAYATVVQKTAEMHVKKIEVLAQSNGKWVAAGLDSAIAEIDQIILVIPWVGLASACLCVITMKMAAQAISRLQGHWDKVIRGTAAGRPGQQQANVALCPNCFLPALTCGVRTANHLFYDNVPQSIPLALIVTWAWLGTLQRTNHPIYAGLLIVAAIISFILYAFAHVRMDSSRPAPCRCLDPLPEESTASADESAATPTPRKQGLDVPRRPPSQ